MTEEAAKQSAPAPQRVQRPPPPAPQRAAAPATGPAADPAPAEVKPAPLPERVDGVTADGDGYPENFVRKPFGSTVQKLSAPKREGYHRHWFNDELDRIETAVAAGYKHVNDERTGAPMKKVVGTSKLGGAQIAFLMEIPLAWYLEDMKREQRKADEIDEQIRGGAIAKKEGDERYVPNDGKAIKVEAQSR